MHIKGTGYFLEKLKINPKRKTSPSVSHILEVNAIIHAKVGGIIKLSVNTITPSRTPKPAGTKMANNPINPAPAVVPVINK